MTRAEKIAQLGSFWAFEVVGEHGLDAGRLAALAADGIGHITRLAGSTNLRPIEVAETANAIQRRLVEGTRLGIPAIIHEECLHGLIAWAAPCFQQSIGAAATFDPDTVTAMAETVRRRMLLTGARHALAPVLDIARDPRWGRIEETYGEDPYLASALGCAYIEALQGPDLADGVLATAKHMVGHGLAEGGRNQAPAHVGHAGAAQRAARPVRGGDPPRRHRERHAGVLRGRRRAVPRLARAADDDPARRVGVRRDHRLRLHGRRDDRDRAPADGEPRRGGPARPRCRRRRRAAAHGRLRDPAAGRPGRRQRGRGAARRRRRSGCSG